MYRYGTGLDAPHIPNSEYWDWFRLRSLGSIPYSECRGDELRTRSGGLSAFPQTWAKVHSRDGRFSVDVRCAFDSVPQRACALGCSTRIAFSLRIIEAVVALSRRSGELDDEFVRRAASNPLARVVKRADLEDNLVQAEQAGLDTSKYLAGLELLQNM